MVTRGIPSMMVTKGEVIIVTIRNGTLAFAFCAKVTISDGRSPSLKVMI